MDSERRKTLQLEAKMPDLDSLKALKAKFPLFLKVILLASMERYSTFVRQSTGKSHHLLWLNFMILH